MSLCTRDEENVCTLSNMSTAAVIKEEDHNQRKFTTFGLTVLLNSRRFNFLIKLLNPIVLSSVVYKQVLASTGVMVGIIAYWVDVITLLSN